MNWLKSNFIKDVKLPNFFDNDVNFEHTCILNYYKEIKFFISFGSFNKLQNSFKLKILNDIKLSIFYSNISKFKQTF